MRKATDIVGQRFSRLVVQSLGPSRSGRGGSQWNCLCDCGNTSLVRADSLKKGHTTSCGCYQREVNIARNYIHGMHNSPTYSTWEHMLDRCSNPNFKHYSYYGGRGIIVCERWHSFINFYADMGNRPEGKTLDRWPNNNGNYEPLNCRWATRSEQQYNRRKPAKKIHLESATREPVLVCNVPSP